METQAQTCSRDPPKGFFLIKTLHKPFLLSLVALILRILHTTEMDADVIGMWPHQDIARTWTHGVYY